MKFVVNRVHTSSAKYFSNLHGLEVKINTNLHSIIDNVYRCNGWACGDIKENHFCYGFTIAEVPETEEGYYLL